MKQIVNYLEQLGFTKIEIKIYLKLLSSGPMTITNLAEAIKINRTSIYIHINSLLKKGIINQVKGLQTKVHANSPEQITYLLDQKIASVKIMEDSLATVINTLNSLSNTISSEPKSEIKYYKGAASIKNLYNQALRSKLIRSYFSPTDVRKIFPENSKLFDKALQNNKELKIYEICEDSALARENINITKKFNRHHWKFLPPNIKLTSNDILIYEGQVTIINLQNKESIDGIVLNNIHYYKNSIQLFDLLWSLLPNPIMT